MFLLVLLLPMLLSMFIGAMGRLFGYRGAAILSVLYMCVVNCCALYIFYVTCIEGSMVELYLFDWFNVELLAEPYVLCFDSLVGIMLIIVTFVSTVTQIYAVEYMNADPHRIRFTCYLLLFTFFMELLVTAGNLVQLFIGWEGVGICSYLLINFWYTRIQANKAALSAVFTNKISDICFLLALSLMYASFHTFNIYVLEHLITNNILCFFAGLLFVCAAIGKSAQVGLHMWLPEAMEGPTPVSALIHAATMVTAGIFILCRLSFIIEQFSFVRLFIIVVGGFTICVGAIIGTVLYDLKKVIAYSTCSQLGYMFFGCGLSQYTDAVYHLTVHAFFKALLFLSAGYVIHALADEQDMRKFGGLYKMLPTAYLFFLLGFISLIGVPPFGGFFTKELLVFDSYVYMDHDYSMVFFFLISLFSTCGMLFTTIYSVLGLYHLFFGTYRGRRNTLVSIHYFSIVTIVALVVLFYLTLLFPFYTRAVFLFI